LLSLTWMTAFKFAFDTRFFKFAFDTRFFKFAFDTPSLLALAF
jgi:hypothetical protein